MKFINDIYDTLKIFWERLISKNERYNVNIWSVDLVKIRSWKRITQKNIRWIRSNIEESEMKQTWRQTTLLILALLKSPKSFLQSYPNSFMFTTDWGQICSIVISENDNNILTKLILFIHCWKITMYKFPTHFPEWVTFSHAGFPWFALRVRRTIH